MPYPYKIKELAQSTLESRNETDLSFEIDDPFCQVVLNKLAVSEDKTDVIEIINSQPEDSSNLREMLRYLLQRQLQAFKNTPELEYSVARITEFRKNKNFLLLFGIPVALVEALDDNADSERLLRLLMAQEAFIEEKPIERFMYWKEELMVAFNRFLFWPAITHYLNQEIANAADNEAQCISKIQELITSAKNAHFSFFTVYNQMIEGSPSEPLKLGLSFYNEEELEKEVTQAGRLSPLHKLCRDNNVESVKLLRLACGEKIFASQVFSSSYTIFRNACQNGNEQIVKLLLTAFDKENFRKEFFSPDNGITLACQNKHAAVLNVLFEYYDRMNIAEEIPQELGDDVNGVDTALLAASANDDIKTLSKLFNSHNQNVHSALLRRIDHGLLKHAVRNKSTQTTDFLLGHYNTALLTEIMEKELFNDAIKCCSLEIILRLCDDDALQPRLLKRIPSLIVTLLIEKKSSSYSQRESASTGNQQSQRCPHAYKKCKALIIFFGKYCSISELKIVDRNILNLGSAISDGHFSLLRLNQSILNFAIAYNHSEIAIQIVTMHFQKLESSDSELTEDSFLQKILTHSANNNLPLYLIETIGDLFKRPRAAGCFSKVVLLSDDYLKIKSGQEINNTIRFFKIALKLPIELQMVLCNRLYGVSGDLILNTEFELAARRVLSHFH